MSQDPGMWSSVRNTVRALYTIPPFIAAHGWRSRHINRRHLDVDELSEPTPPHQPHDHLQSRDHGVGPIVMRTYRVDISAPTKSEDALMKEFRIDPNHFNSSLVAGFVDRDRPARNLAAGDEFVVELPGPWNGPVVVEHADDDQVMLATLDGHMEAGHVRFDTAPSGDGDGYAFRIRSWARAGGPGFAAVHVGVPLAKELQTAMWTAMCDRAVTVSGGQRRGNIAVSTEELNDSDRSSSS